jgi:Transposase, Mutator family
MQGDLRRETHRTAVAGDRKERRYEREPEAPPGKHNGLRPRRLQAAENELRLEIPLVREAAEPFVWKLFPRGKRLLRSEPLKAMVVGAFVRGRSMRDIESLSEEAGLGRISKTRVADLQGAAPPLRCVRARALRRAARRAVPRRDLLPICPQSAEEGVLCTWGIAEGGQRVLLSVCLGCAGRRRIGPRSAAT